MTRLIAEIGANHMGDMGLAKAMIDAAQESGADTVKFQSWRADALSPSFPGYDEAFARHGRTQLSDADHRDLITYCHDKGVTFLTTCFDIERVDFLADLGLEEVKVASPDCGSLAMIDALMKRFPRLLISTGMTPAADVLNTIEATKGHDVVFLHCVSLYPTPPERVNLARMDWLKNQGARVGYSDHSMGVDAACIATARGAEVIEKHFTLTRKLPGKDQAVSGEPAEFSEIARFIATFDAMLGTPEPEMSDEEQKLRSIYVGKWGDNR